MPDGRDKSTSRHPVRNISRHTSRCTEKFTVPTGMLHLSRVCCKSVQWSPVAHVSITSCCTDIMRDGHTATSSASCMPIGSRTPSGTKFSCSNSKKPAVRNYTITTTRTDHNDCQPVLAERQHHELLYRRHGREERREMKKES